MLSMKNGVMPEFRFEFKKVNTSHIRAAAYQRLPNSKRVNKIVNEFDPNLVNVVKVSYREGVYWDFDGDHTVISCIQHNNNKHLDIWCKVFYGMTYEDEAYYFEKQNGVSKAPSVNEKVNSSYERRDQTTIEVKNILEAYGLVFNPKAKSASVSTPVCFNAIMRAYNDDKLAFEYTIKTIASAWNGDVQSLREEILNGLFRFYKVYREDLTQKKINDFISKLRNRTPSQIIKEGKESLNNGKYKYARIFLYIYNYRLGGNNKLADRFYAG